MAPWEPPPESLPEPAGEAHLWFARLDVSASEHKRLCHSLSSEEWARAARFSIDRVRQRFMTGRGVLRAILGRYLDCSPERVRLTYGPWGKPELVSDPGVEPLSFNLAHSGEILLCAVSRGRKVGVDVEAVLPVDPGTHMTNICLTETERGEFYRLPVQDRPLAFIRGWTCKEACLKASGLGMYRPLQHLSVTVDLSHPPRVITSPRGERWWLSTLVPSAGYMGAVAIEGNEIPLRYWHWDTSSGHTSAL